MERRPKCDLSTRHCRTLKIIVKGPHRASKPRVAMTTNSVIWPMSRPNLADKLTWDRLEGYNLQRLAISNNQGLQTRTFRGHIRVCVKTGGPPTWWFFL